MELKDQIWKEQLRNRVIKHCLLHLDKEQGRQTQYGGGYAYWLPLADQGYCKY